MAILLSPFACSCGQTLTKADVPHIYADRFQHGDNPEHVLEVPAAAGGEECHRRLREWLHRVHEYEARG